MDRRLSPRHFDASKPLVAARFMTLEGVDLDRGSPIPESTSQDLKLRLWTSARAVYAENFGPVPVAEEVQAPVVDPATLVTVTHVGGGVYEVAAPQLDEPERVKGKDKAEARADELRAEASERPEDLAPAQPDWSGFDENPEAWTDDQRETFNTWFDSVPEGAAVEIAHTGVAQAFTERRDDPAT